MRNRLAALFSSASLLLGGCATGPQYTLAHNDRCSVEVKDENGRLIGARFDEVCGRQANEGNIARDNAAATIAVQQIETQRLVLLLQILANRAKFEIEDPQREAIATQKLVDIVMENDAVKNERVREALLKAGISEAAFNQKIEERRNKRCVVRDNEIICGLR
jgi:hypothetical protein